MDTLEVTFELTPKEPWSEITIAELADLGFDSFVSTDDGFMAYGNATIDWGKVLEQLSVVQNEDVSLNVSEKVIPYQNWNATWEENFQPVEVEDYATILAPFHEEADAKGLKVTIQPQMSFGTGHHQTTWMMTKAMFELDVMPEKVLDMGTGTGVLAVVAEKLGAKDILAIDIEEWSAENARENTERNACRNIECVWGDIDKVPDTNFGLILANINKNVLKSHMKRYSDVLEKGGILLLSGFFVSDVEEMAGVCKQYGLEKTKVFEKDEWAALQLIKSN